MKAFMDIMYFFLGWVLFVIVTLAIISLGITIYEITPDENIINKFIEVFSRVFNLLDLLWKAWQRGL